MGDKESKIPVGDYCDNCPYWKLLGLTVLCADPEKLKTSKVYANWKQKHPKFKNITVEQCEFFESCADRDHCWEVERTCCRHEIVRCEYLDLTDEEEDTLLWDGCKECGVNIGMEG